MLRALERNGWTSSRKPGCGAERSCSINSWMDCRPCGQRCDPSFWRRAGNIRLRNCLAKAELYSLELERVSGTGYAKVQTAMMLYWSMHNLERTVAKAREGIIAATAEQD